MTTLVATQNATALRRAAVRATLAPSVHNTQPWRLHLGAGRLDVVADRARRLPVLDPTARQMTISVGCALFNARVSMAGDGIGVDVRRHPDPARPDLLASLRPTGAPADVVLATLDPLLELRQTNRRRFADDAVPTAVIEALEAAAAAEDAGVFVVRDPVQRAGVARLSQQAEDVENLNPAYRAELRAWTSDDPARRDGVPCFAVSHLDGTDLSHCVLLLCTDADTPVAWLRAGEALERVLLEITRHGFAASLLTQVTEVPSARAQLRRDLGVIGYPHVLLRVGRAPATPASRRRRLVDVLIEETA
jgi:hypothetical protein